MSEPYYRDEFVTLYHGDCREIDAWLAADVLVTDPPYGRGWRQGEIKGKTRNAASTTGIANDADTGARDSALVAWGERHAVVFGDLMLPPPAGTKQVCVYHKASGCDGARGAMGGMRRDAEAIYLIGPWSTGLGGRTSVFATSQQISTVNGVVRASGGHPHAKPQDVMRPLIEACPPGVIADPFAGSGSTLVAAKALGRHAIGVELDEGYCHIAASRLGSTEHAITGAGSLFGAVS